MALTFEKMTSLIKILDTAETERAAGFRLKNIKKAQLIIIDEIGYTPISRGQANRFFTFISDTYETSSIIFTTNKEIVDLGRDDGRSGAYHRDAGPDPATMPSATLSEGNPTAEAP